MDFPHGGAKGVWSDSANVPKSKVRDWGASVEERISSQREIGPHHIDYFDGSFARAAELGVTQLMLGKGQRYNFDDVVKFTHLFDLNLNGSTIVCPRGGLEILDVLREYEGITGTAVTEGAVEFTIPPGVTVNEGETLRIESDDIFCPKPVSNPYKYGQISSVVKVTGSTCRISQPFVGDFEIHRIYVLRPLRISIYNGTLDMSGAVEVSDSSELPPVGIVAKGREVYFNDIHVIGGDHAGKGLIGQAEKVRAAHVTGHGILNAKGYGSGAARWGYVADLSGYDVLADHSGGSECKHAIGSGARNFVTQNLTYRDCWGHNPKGDHTRYITLKDGANEPRYLAPLDAHGGVNNFTLVRPVLKSPNNLVSTRAKRTKIIDPVLTSYGCKNGSLNQWLVAQAEQVIDLLEIVRPTVAWEPGVTTGGDDAAQAGRDISLVGVSSDISGDHGEISIVSPRGGSYRFVSVKNNPAVNIEAVKVVDAEGTFNGGIVLGGAGAARIGNIGSIEVTGSTKLRKAGGIDAKSLIDAQVDRLDRITVKGRHDNGAAGNSGALVKLGNSGDNMLMPMTADFSNAELIAYVTAFSIQTADSTRSVGRWSFDGAHIKYHVRGTDYAGQGVSAVMGSAPSEPWTFWGTTFDDSNTPLDDSEDIRILANSFVNLSGSRLTKDPALGNGDEKLIPIGCHVRGAATVTIRQSGEANPYLVRPTGEIERHSRPDFTNLPVGTIVWNNSVAAGGSLGWTRVSTGEWKAMAAVES